MGVLDSLGIDQTKYNEIPEQQATGGSSALEPGVYDVAVEKAFVRKTDSGASMLELEFITAAGETFPISICIKKKDGSENKSGIADMKHFLEATGIPNPDPVEGEVKWKDSNIKALCMPSLTGSTIKVGIRNEENEFNGSVFMKNIVSAYMTKDGKNGKGEEIATEVAEKISKNPVKTLKKSTTTTSSQQSSGSESAAAAAAGW